MLSLTPVNSSVCNDDISGSNRPSAVAAAGVRLIPFRFSCSRVSCAILAIVFTSAVQQCA